MNPIRTFNIITGIHSVCVYLCVVMECKTRKMKFRTFQTLNEPKLYSAHIHNHASYTQQHHCIHPLSLVENIQIVLVHRMYVDKKKSLPMDKKKKTNKIKRRKIVDEFQGGGDVKFFFSTLIYGSRTLAQLKN